MARKFMWYFGSEDEGRYQGECSTKDQAIAEGRAWYGADPFTIIEAASDTYDFEITGSDLCELLDGKNEHRSDPDGDYLSADWTKEQIDDLERRVNAAVLEWIGVHNISNKAWYFIEQRNMERVPPLSDAAMNGLIPGAK